MSMHDLVVRNGTLIDGTGAASRQVDVAIDEGLITALESKAGRARREVNAEGMLVTPGWVDIHTHYDGQATWDPAMTPSSWYGVDYMTGRFRFFADSPPICFHHQRISGKVMD